MHNQFLIRPVFFLFKLLYPAKIHDKENYPEGRAVIVCNHFNGTDPLYIYNFAKKNLYFFAKKELFKNKLLAKIITEAGAIPVARDKSDARAVINAMNLLKKENKLIIFPEGTRNKINEELQEIKGGAGIIAVKTKSPIVPIMFYKHSKIFHRRHILVGKPFELSDFYDKKLTQEDYVKMDEIIRNRMVETLNELKEIRTAKKKRKEKCRS